MKIPGKGKRDASRLLSASILLLALLALTTPRVEAQGNPVGGQPAASTFPEANSQLKLRGIDPARVPDNGAQVNSQSQTQAQTSQSAPGQGGSQPLQGVAELGAVTAEGLGVRSYLISVCRARDFKCVLVHLKNGSGLTITADGDNAKAVMETETIEPNSTRQLARRACCGLSLASEITLAVVSIPFLGLPGPILYEMMTNKRDWNHFYESGYGWLNDGLRHEIEGLRFGKRVLLPGDETDGWFCFKAGQLKGKATLRIPVNSGSKSAIVEIAVPDNTLAEKNAVPEAKQ